MKVNRVVTEEDLALLQQGDDQVTRDVWKRICRPSGSFLSLLLAASTSPSTVRSRHFKDNKGFFVRASEPYYA